MADDVTVGMISKADLPTKSDGEKEFIGDYLQPAMFGGAAGYMLCSAYKFPTEIGILGGSLIGIFVKHKISW